MTGILRNTDGDLEIVNGGLQLGNNTEDVIETILMSASGEMKHAPLVGANLIKSVNGSVDVFMVGRIKNMLIAEHVPVVNLKINGSEITIEL